MKSKIKVNRDDNKFNKIRIKRDRKKNCKKNIPTKNVKGEWVISWQFDMELEVYIVKLHVFFWNIILNVRRKLLY